MDVSFHGVKSLRYWAAAAASELSLYTMGREMQWITVFHLVQTNHWQQQSVGQAKSALKSTMGAVENYS